MSSCGSAILFPYAHGRTAGFKLYAQWRVSCANGGTCVVGDIGPGGGAEFYADEGGFACGPDLTLTCKYLEAAPTDGAQKWTDRWVQWSNVREVQVGQS